MRNFLQGHRNHATLSLSKNVELFILDFRKHKLLLNLITVKNLAIINKSLKSDKQLIIYFFNIYGIIYKYLNQMACKE
ncbi:hypothetical protein GWI33_019828 [Rhynchophorus ferrugineus]|uniref:Uncharacterized protein n=1 Tax=Rhynchophorus ferrugineus TaxID=354439 RepID=A0A834HQN3_RHYFE|nr:hypothetical protein GWI33_019828 [Rhynchophorus ferrugineus]